MRSQDMTDEEIAWAGHQLYDRHLRPHLEPVQNGRYAVISVENGDYAIADTTTEAGTVMRARYPDQVFYECRIGYDAVSLWPSSPTRDVARTS